MTDASRPAPALGPTDLAACRAAIRNGSKSFHAASLLLPGRIRGATRALYAFCRAYDDHVDEADRAGRAAELKLRLDRIYGRGGHDALSDRAFASVVFGYGIPRALPGALVEGFEWDEAGRRYRTMADLLTYCARVASSVGVMMTIIMGRRNRNVLARAADLGLAMQLTNIARDVGEDARRGRVYLPLDWLAEAGIDADTLITSPSASPGLCAAVERTLRAADFFYDRALTGISGLPADCRLAIRSAALIYRAIGDVIRQAGCNSVDGRAHTGKWRKLELISYAAATPFSFRSVAVDPPDGSTRFLVDAAMSGHVDLPLGFDANLGRFIDLIAVSERRHRALTLQTRGRSAPV